MKRLFAIAAVVAACPLAAHAADAVSLGGKSCRGWYDNPFSHQDYGKGALAIEQDATGRLHLWMKIGQAAKNNFQTASLTSGYQDQGEITLKAEGNGLSFINPNPKSLRPYVLTPSSPGVFKLAVKLNDGSNLPGEFHCR